MNSTTLAMHLFEFDSNGAALHVQDCFGRHCNSIVTIEPQVNTYGFHHRHSCDVAEALPASRSTPFVSCPSRNRGCAAVIIDHELLQSLEDCPLQKAAERLDVSITGLKNACRALGVTRWQCRTRTKITPLHNGVAYARKLFRKYSAPKPKEQGCTSSGVQGCTTSGVQEPQLLSPSSAVAPCSQMEPASPQRTFWDTPEVLEIGDGWDGAGVDTSDADELLSSIESVWPDDF